jgi:hypothetical protein
MRRLREHATRRMAPRDAIGLELREAKQTVLALGLSQYDPLCARGMYIRACKKMQKIHLKKTI